MTSLPVSAIIMTKDEANNIGKCIESLGGVAEIFVVDSGSTDGTQQIASDLGARVVNFRWNGQYPKKKQWCLENLPFRNDWVFYVDADEEATPELLREIRERVDKPTASGYFVGYDYLFDGKILRHGQRAYKLVLFDRHRGRFEPYDDLDASNMWEVEGHYQPVIDGPVATLKSPMLHKDHDSLYHYFDRHNRYSDWEAVVRSRNQYATGAESQLSGRGRMKEIFDRLPLKAPAAFAYSYFLKLGFLDGRAGLNFALARAFYYWQIDIKSEELRRTKAND